MASCTKNVRVRQKRQAGNQPETGRERKNLSTRELLQNAMADLNLPFIANSDFHKPKHIYSWKTLIHAAKDPEAIKDCIRRNEHVAITLYRDFAPAAINSQPLASSNLPYFQDKLPLRVVNH